MTRYDGSSSFPLGEAPVSSYFVLRPEQLSCRPTQPEHTSFAPLLPKQLHVQREGKTRNVFTCVRRFLDGHVGEGLPLCSEEGTGVGGG